MKFQIEGPPALEAVQISATATSLTVQPLTVRGQHIVRVGYLTASGDNGTESKAVLLFNGNTGDFSIQRLDGTPVSFAFDKPQAEFIARRETARAASKAKHTKRVAAAQTPPSVPPKGAP